MPEELSDYELQRLANVARNQAVLEELGLAGNNSMQPAKPPKKPPVKRSLPNQYVQPIRRSSRATNAPDSYGDHCQLTDAFFRREEIEAERADRPQRKRSKPQTYAAEQHRQNALNEAKLNKARQERREASRIHAVTAPPPMPSIQNTSFNRSGFFPTVVTSHAKSYHTDGQQGQCPVCLGLFVVRKSDGRLREHYCVPAQPVLPSMA